LFRRGDSRHRRVSQEAEGSFVKLTQQRAAERRGGDVQRCGVAQVAFATDKQVERLNAACGERAIEFKACQRAHF
jgi:hypothetical protein